MYLAYIRKWLLTHEKGINFVLKLEKLSIYYVLKTLIKS